MPKNNGNNNSPAKKIDIALQIYTNINTYRLHEDNLRWTLWIGYLTFSGTVIYFLTTNKAMTNFEIAYLCVAAFIISICYFFILAVQNWFYNAFAQFCDECERKLIDGHNISTIKMFMEKNGPYITPLHPAFSFALIIVLFTSSWFLIMAFQNLFPVLWEIISEKIWKSILIEININLLLIYGGFLSLKYWDKVLYKPIIKKLSNYYHTTH